MVAGPKDEMAAGLAGRGRMRASHADREQAIEALKAAFVQGRLTKNELDSRAGQAFTARTCAELAALTADIPPAVASVAADPVRLPAAARRRPLARASVAASICLLIAAAVIAASGSPPSPIQAVPMPSGPALRVALAASGVWTAIGIMACAVVTALDQRPSRRLPPRPEPGGQAPEVQRPGQVGHDPALPRDRPDPPAPTCGLTAHGRVGCILPGGVAGLRAEYGRYRTPCNRPLPFGLARSNVCRFGNHAPLCQHHH